MSGFKIQLKRQSGLEIKGHALLGQLETPTLDNERSFPQGFCMQSTKDTRETSSFNFTWNFPPLVSTVKRRFHQNFQRASNHDKVSNGAWPLTGRAPGVNMKVHTSLVFVFSPWAVGQNCHMVVRNQSTFLLVPEQDRNHMLHSVTLL